MKVKLFLVDNLHYGTAAASRALNYARVLEASGAEVEIVMAFVFVTDPDKLSFPASGLFEGVRYRYMVHLDDHPKRKFGKLQAYLWFLTGKILAYWRLFKEASRKESKEQVHLLYDFSIQTTWFLQKFSGSTPCVLDLCEIPFFDKPEPKKSQLRGRRERWNLIPSAGVITISPALTRYVSRLRGSDRDIVEIPILVQDSYAQTGEAPALPEGIQQPFVLHTGSLTDRKDGITGIIRAVMEYNKQTKNTLHLYCTGYLEHSEDRQKIVDLIAELGGTERIHFLGFISKEKLKALQSHCSMAFMHKLSNEQNEYCFPTKLAEYQMMRIPVLASKTGILGEILRDKETALLFDEDQIGQMLEGIHYLLSQPEAARKMAEAGRVFAMEHFTTRANAAKLRAFFDSRLRK